MVFFAVHGDSLSEIFASHLELAPVIPRASLEVAGERERGLLLLGSFRQITDSIGECLCDFDLAAQEWLGKLSRIRQHDLQWLAELLAQGSSAIVGRGGF